MNVELPHMVYVLVEVNTVSGVVIVVTAYPGRSIGNVTEPELPRSCTCEGAF